MAQASAHDLFVNLCQFARHRGLTIAQYFTCVIQRSSDSVRGFIKDERRWNRAEFFEFDAPRIGTRRRKAGKEKLIGGQTGSHQRAHERSGSGNWNDG